MPKGLMGQLMQIGSRDFLSGDPIELTTYFDLAIDIHHIFPRSYCERKELPKSRWNSIVNKASLSAKTNRIIGGRAPSVYVASLEKQHGGAAERLGQILHSHRIHPEFLRQDDFEGFFQDRAAKLLDLIEAAMGKSVSGRDTDEVIAAFGGPLAPRETTESAA